jgi:hypothetical protein
LRGEKLALKAGAPRGSGPKKSGGGGGGGDAREVAAVFAGAREIVGEAQIELRLGARVEVPERLEI